MDFKKQHASPELEVDGVWVNYMEDARVKLARMGNKRTTKAYEAVFKPVRQRMERGKLSLDEETRLNIKVAAETIVLDWENITIDDQPFPYSIENASQLLTDYTDFREWVLEQSSAAENFFQKQLKDEAGNS